MHEPGCKIRDCSLQFQNARYYDLGFFLTISFDLVPQAKDDNEVFIQEQSFGSRSMENCSFWES